MAILDHRGNPIEQRTLREPQTARIGWVTQEFAGHPSRGLTPGKLARILMDAEQGNLTDQLDLADDLEEKDAHIYAELAKRRRALLGLDWSVAPPPDASAAEQRAAEQAEASLRNLPDFEDLLYDLLDGILKGFAAAEIEWQRGAAWLPAAIELRPQRWLQLPRASGTRRSNELRLRDGSSDGAPLTAFGWIVHHHKARSGYLARASLARVLAWPFLFKNYSVRDLAEFLEIYGLPLRLGKYPHNASDDEKATLMQAVASIGHAAAGIIPEGMAIEFQEAAKGASGPYLAMIDWAERSESKAILGQTLSAEAAPTGLGSGVASLQGEVRDDILVSDARQLAGTLTRDLVWPLVVLNGWGSDPARAPRFVFDTSQPEDIKLYSEALPRLVDIGLQIPLAHAHERLGIPQPLDDEPVLARATPAGVAGLRTAAARLSGPPQDAVDAFVDRLDRDSAAALADLIDPIRDLLDDVQDLDQFRDRLLEIYPDLDESGFAELMQQALLAAHLAGRFEAG